MVKFLSVIAGIFAGDQWIKESIEKKEPLNGRRNVAGGKITITK